MDYKVKLQNIIKNTNLSGINKDAVGFVLNKLIFNSSKSQFLHICKDDKEIETLQKQVEFFSSDKIKNNEFEVLTFPAWDCLAYDRVSPKQEIVAVRASCLHKLSRTNSNKKTLVITSIAAILQKTIPVNLVKNLGFQIGIGDEISIDKLANALIDNGFTRNGIANDISEFAIRGNIVDIISANNQMFPLSRGNEFASANDGGTSNQFSDDIIGYRLDFFGDHVESIKVFDPLTQITSNKINKINLMPMSEVNLTAKNINNFRNNYRTLFGVPQEDLMYNAVCEGRHYPGIEHFMSLFYDEHLSDLFSYLNDPQVSFFDDVLKEKDERLANIAEYYQARVDSIKESKNAGSIYNPLPTNHLYLSNEEFLENLQKNLIISFGLQNNNERNIDLEIKSIPDFAFASRANKINTFELLKNFLSAEFKNHKIVLFCFSLGSQERLRKILNDHEINSRIIADSSEISKLPSGQIGLLILPFGNGFLTSDLIAIGECALLGEKVKQASLSKSAEQILSQGLTFEVGELVVHRYHGIGKFDGLHNIAAGGIKNDFLKILYAGSDVLFVPVEDINLITRYGSDNALIELDRLGGTSWKTRKEKVRKRIKIAAESLIKIAAERQVKKSPILIPNQMEYEEFKASFGFTETSDQLKSIADIEEDFQKGSPMDRLVCGDVGFGKTEVAIRAAFIAARNEYRNYNNDELPIKEPIINKDNSTLMGGDPREAGRNECSVKNTGYQVAIITPTTLLCRQHYRNFKNRFAGTNTRVEQLSRMVTAAESKKIKQDLEDGKIDIIIGTHALLNKNIKFKKLGLLIVDEEQHFGVAQKERIKEFKNEVHILTLSATPIPRTLQMSLSGVKELSIIATPPPDRIAVRNYVMPYDPVIVREAILREHNRGGRTFFVVPRIQDLNQLHEKLVKHMPEIKFEAAHGQMPPAKLDEIMNDFYDGKFDCLLSTTIVESGIDISSANTMIIYKAEHFGLAQLYQLRGRVGRGKIRGYCYFTTKINQINEIAKRKLQVIQSLDTLGSGFSIASHDMDIRGSGNILGDEQSGHIRETGAELYQSMLIEEVRKLKSGIKTDNKTIEIKEEDIEYSVQIKLGISLLIPESYMPDLQTRMQFYKRIADIKTAEEQEQIKLEIIDRFGNMPEEINNLLQITYLKYVCKKLNIERLENTSAGILVSFKNNHFAQGDKLLEMVFSSKNQIKLQGHRLLFSGSFKTDMEKLNNALKILNELNSLSQ